MNPLTEGLEKQHPGQNLASLFFFYFFFFFNQFFHFLKVQGERSSKDTACLQKQRWLINLIMNLQKLIL